MLTFKSNFDLPQEMGTRFHESLKPKYYCFSKARQDIEHVIHQKCALTGLCQTSRFFRNIKTVCTLCIWLF